MFCFCIVPLFFVSFSIDAMNWTGEHRPFIVETFIKTSESVTATQRAFHLHFKLGRHLGSWNCLPHQAHIALSEPMSSTNKQGSSLGSFPTSPPLYPHFNRPSGFWPCVKSCLVGGSDKYSAWFRALKRKSTWNDPPSYR